jgi:hypothetical protein
VSIRNFKQDTKNERLDLVEVLTPTKTEKTAHRGGAGNVEAPSPTATERSDRQNFIGYCSGRAHIRTERWQWLESDHCNPEKTNKRREREREIEIAGTAFGRK